MHRNYLILIVQHGMSAAAGSAKNITRFSFPKRALLWFSLCIALVAVFGVRGSWTMFENQSLRQEITTLRDSLSYLEELDRKVEAVRREERMIRDFLGIEAWDKNFNLDDRLGMGGAEAEDTGDFQSFDPMTELESLVDERPLHKRVCSLRSDVRDLNEILSRMTETLRCRPTIMPVKDDEIWITSGFGWRKSPFTGQRQFHRGLDISGRRGAPIIATADGEVSRVGYNRFLGNYVWITHDERFETGYGHLLKAQVEKGQKVQRGQVIGLMGTTGMSTGYHLHYEVVDNGTKVNPYSFILNRDDTKMSLARR